MPETRRHVLEELLTKARTLSDDSGYDPAFKEETLWDTLVFGLRSDKGRKEKKTKIRCPTPELEPTIHLRCNAKSTCRQGQVQVKCIGCFRCGNKHGTTHNCSAMRAKCQYCGKTGHFKPVCMTKRLKQVKVIAQNPDYRGQDIYLLVNDEEERDYCGDSSENSEPITVVLDTITSENTVDVVSSNPERIISTVKINDTRSIPMKVDTGADTCVLTTDYLQKLGLCLDIKPCNVVRKSYGGNTITNLGTSALKITFKGNSASANFHIVAVAFPLPERRPWQE